MANVEWPDENNVQFTIRSAIQATDSSTRRPQKKPFLHSHSAPVVDLFALVTTLPPGISNDNE